MLFSLNGKWSRELQVNVTLSEVTGLYPAISSRGNLTFHFSAEALVHRPPGHGYRPLVHRNRADTAGLLHWPPASAREHGLKLVWPVKTSMPEDAGAAWWQQLIALSEELDRVEAVFERKIKI